MKRFTIILALTLAALVSKAQTVQPADSVVTIHLKQSQLNQLKEILSYTYQHRLNTQWPASDTETLRIGIEGLFAILRQAVVPVTKPTDPKKKKS